MKSASIIPRGASGETGSPSVKKLTGKAGIRALFLSRIGQIVTTKDVFVASGEQGQYGRRLRELRDEEGWDIQSHNDASDLKPNEYRLMSFPPIAAPVRISRSIGARLRAQVLERNGFTCQMCGVSPGEIDEQTGRPARLHVGHIVDKSHGGTDTLDNLRALCSTCNQGAKNLGQEPPSRVWLLSQVRRANVKDQRAVLEWLHKKFNLE